MTAGLKMAAHFLPHLEKGASSLQTVEESPEGGIILTAEVPHLEEVARWVLSGAPHIHVVEPAELKGLVKEFAEGAIDM